MGFVWGWFGCCVLGVLAVKMYLHCLGYSLLDVVADSENQATGYDDNDVSTFVRLDGSLA